MKRLTAQELIDDAVDTIDEAMQKKLGQQSIREPLDESTESKQGQATIHEIAIIVTPDLDTMVTHNVNEEHEQAYREKMEQGDTEIVGVIAKATLQTARKNANGDLYTRVHPNAIQSMGLWGIEIDSSEASSNYLKEVAQEELDDLKDELEMLNVDLSNFDEKAKEALDKM